MSDKVFPALPALMLVTAALSAWAGEGTDGPLTEGGPAVVRRLTQDQYRQAIADIFGPDIKVGGRFEPDIRSANGLIATGASQVAVTPSGLEQYDVMARSIADQVVDKDHRGILVPCAPKSARAPDAACAGKFFSKVGPLIFRRRLTARELDVQIAIANAGAQKLGDFYQGLALSLVGLLDSPNFLFRIEDTTADPKQPGSRELTPYAKASRISFLIWDSIPDEELLTAAANGDLDNKEGLTREVDRLLASPRLEQGVEVFFSDMLQFETFRDLQKDAALYPKFSLQAAEDSKEQALRTIVEVLITEHGDYRDLFTTHKTFLTRTLGPLYDVPVDKVDGWEPYEFPPDSPRAGILTQLGFVALHSHAGRSSPTLRGKAVRELLLCQKVPDPPGNVDFTLFEDTTNAVHRTARDRLTAHRSSPACAGCHKIMDPIGLALENFDTAGEFRTTENAAPIDTSGELNGVPFKNAADLGKILHDAPAVPSCLVRRVYEYGTGRSIEKGEIAWLGDLTQRFADDGYRFPELLRRVALSDAFYRIAPESSQSEHLSKTALNSNNSQKRN
jgi:hypothetical protein